MLNIQFIEKNTAKVKKAIVDKKIDLDLDHLLELNEKRKARLCDLEVMRAERNSINSKINVAKKDERDELVGRGKNLKAYLTGIEEEYKKIQAEYDALMVRVPNITSPDTPDGISEDDNVEIFRSSDIPEFDFNPRNHIEIGHNLDIIDLDRGAKVAGYRGYYIKNEGVSLMLGFMMYAMNKMTASGFNPMLVPTIVKGFSLFGTGYFKGAEYDQNIDEIYKVSSDSAQQKEQKFLVGTAEPSLLAYYSDEILSEDQLPIKLCGFSQCYRSEIGSHGRDTKGLYRVHEFMKVEQIVIMKSDIEESIKMQNQMMAISREMHEELGLPYRQLHICAGDMGPGKYRMFDIEAWMPGLNRWGETGSASNFLDWQARRLNVKYKTVDGKKEYVYMLNNTALPSPRIFIAILENYQQKDGSVLIPEAIKPFMPMKCEVIRPK